MLRKDESGQALVEMALVLPLFFLLLFGIVEMSRIGYAYISVNNAARSGARVASVGGTNQEITAAVDNAINLDPNSAIIEISPGEQDRQSGNEVTVKVSYPVELIIPIISKVLPNPVNVGASLTMRLE